jgi:hypothetical protein
VFISWKIKQCQPQLLSPLVLHFPIETREICPPSSVSWFKSIVLQLHTLSLPFSFMDYSFLHLIRLIVRLKLLHDSGRTQTFLWLSFYSTKVTYYLTVCCRRLVDMSKFTILLNNMRLMAILDWWESARDFILENPENPWPGVFQRPHCQFFTVWWTE